MQLRRPTLSDKNTVMEMMREFEIAQSAHDGAFWDKAHFDYEHWIEQNRQNERGVNLSAGFVPAIQFVSFNAQGRALGFLNLRLRLNEVLLNKGGHIGYSIRPAERGNGFAKEQLRLGILEAEKQHIERILLTCSTDNPPSRQVILANGGILEDIRNGIERYWVLAKSV